jgi:putative addiction module killer protein
MTLRSSRVLITFSEPSCANSIHVAFTLQCPGDVQPVGEGVSELRIYYGPGYRVYYVQRGAVLIVLLCGGNKSMQKRGIEAAKRLAKETA